ncbi:MAG: hypothetical protein ABL931_09335 [Usitatibacteraceae bacterium]
MLTAKPQAAAARNILKKSQIENWIVCAFPRGNVLLLVNVSFTASPLLVLNDLSIWRCDPGDFGDRKMAVCRWNVAEK